MFDKQLLQSVRFRLSLLHQRFELRLKAIQKQGVRHKCRPLFLWLAPCRALRSVPIMGTEIVTAHSVRLFRPRFARPYDSPFIWFHHLPKRSDRSGLFLPRAHGGDAFELATRVFVRRRRSRHYSRYQSLHSATVNTAKTRPRQIYKINGGCRFGATKVRSIINFPKIFRFPIDKSPGVL